MKAKTHRRVRVDFWRHQKTAPLSRLAKLIALRFMTGGHASCIERISLRSLGREVAGENDTPSESELMNAIAECTDRGVLAYDPEQELFWVPDGIDEQGFNGPKNDASTIKHLETLPASPLISQLAARYLEPSPDKTRNTLFRSSESVDCAPAPSPSPSTSTSTAHTEARAEGPLCARSNQDKRDSPAWIERAGGLTSTELTAQVLAWIAAARRESGIQTQALEPTATRKQLACRPIDAGYTLADWWTVIQRQKANCRRQGRDASRNWLKLKTMSVLSKTWEARMEDSHITVPPMPPPGSATHAPETQQEPRWWPFTPFKRLNSMEFQKHADRDDSGPWEEFGPWEPCTQEEIDEWMSKNRQ